VSDATVSPLRALRIALSDTSARYYARHPEPAPWEKRRKHEPVDEYVTFRYCTHLAYGVVDAYGVFHYGEGGGKGVLAYRESGYGETPATHKPATHNNTMRAQFEAMRVLVEADVDAGTGAVLRGDWVVLDVQALPCPRGETPTLCWTVRFSLHTRVDRASEAS